MSTLLFMKSLRLLNYNSRKLMQYIYYSDKAKDRSLGIAVSVFIVYQIRFVSASHCARLRLLANICHVELRKHRLLFDGN